MLRTIISYNGQDIPVSCREYDLMNRVITITDEITEEFAREINSQLRCLARLSEDDITIYINSPGGSVSAGFSIYDTIKSLPCEICTVCTGMAASMAAFLLTASGTKGKRYIHPNAEVLMHQPLGGLKGQASDIKIHAEHILRVKENLNRILSEATDKTLAEINNDTDRDFILNADEALQYGIVDVKGDPLWR